MLSSTKKKALKTPWIGPGYRLSLADIQARVVDLGCPRHTVPEFIKAHMHQIGWMDDMIVVLQKNEIREIQEDARQAGLLPARPPGGESPKAYLDRVKAEGWEDLYKALKKQLDKPGDDIEESKRKARDKLRTLGAFEWDLVHKYKIQSKSFRNACNAIVVRGFNCGYDLFHQRKYVDGVELSDTKVREIREMILHDPDLNFDPGKTELQDALERACEASAYDPVCDYLDRVEKEWDGQDRIYKLFHTYFGAEDTDLNNSLSFVHMIASVHRVRNPGCRYDLVPVLNGPEGLGKSTAIEKLYGGENFSDQKLLGVKDQQLQEQIRGVWGYELCELDGLSSAPLELLKAQISRTHDRVRGAYQRNVVWQPRRCVFIGTTNEDEYLRGRYNRRWVPVKVTKADVEGIIRDRDQLWAEAATYEREMREEGAKLELNPSVWGDAEVEREKRTTQEPWMEELSRVSGVRHPDANGGWEERIATARLWGPDVLNLPVERRDTKVAKRIANIMRKLGWTSYFMQIGHGEGAAKLNGYRRPMSAEQVAWIEKQEAEWKAEAEKSAREKIEKAFKGRRKAAPNEPPGL
jgi:putative DNA primase/helicase